MNERELLRHQIKVMHGFKNGKEVHLQSRDNPAAWFVDASPDWNWALDAWRIKPEPREWEMIECNGYLYPRLPSSHCKTVRVREVLNDITDSE